MSFTALLSSIWIGAESESCKEEKAAINRPDQVSRALTEMEYSCQLSVWQDVWWVLLPCGHSRTGWRNPGQYDGRCTETAVSRFSIINTQLLSIWIWNPNCTWGMFSFWYFWATCLWTLRNVFLWSLLHRNYFLSPTNKDFHISHCSLSPRA